MKVCDPRIRTIARAMEELDDQHYIRCRYHGADWEWYEVAARERGEWRHARVAAAMRVLIAVDDDVEAP